MGAQQGEHCLHGYRRYKMAYEFFVLMQRRKDGKQYADLHKTTEEMFLLEADADRALAGMGSMADHFDKAKMVAVLESEWREIREAP